MKKFFVFLLAAAMLLSLAACGSKPADTSSAAPAETTVSAGASADAAAPAGSAASSETKSGDKGTGPAAIETSVATISVPEGVDYEVSDWYPLEDGTPGGSYSFYLGKGDTNGGCLTFSSTRVVKSLDDAAGECIRVCDYDSSGTNSRGDKVSYNGLDYLPVTVTRAGVTKNFLVAYFQSTDGKDIYVELNKTLISSLDDETAAAILNGVSIKK